MPLDRQSIERRDFPISRRGYDPEAVDAHLARVAGEVESLGPDGGSRGVGGPESLAAVAGAQVASIVQAAEASAAAIQQAAREDADGIRRQAEREASTAREDALERSRTHVDHVAASAGAIADRIDAMNVEITALVESLRAGAQRLHADLSLVAGNIEELYGAVKAPAAPSPVADLESVPEHGPSDGPGDAATDDDAVAEGEDVEGARLIALNMALNGTSREETDRYLAENFDLSDRVGLLDEVYASVEG